MSNMSYCRFQNTVRDMGDCVWELGEQVNGSKSLADYKKTLLDDIERDSLDQLFRMCCDFIDHYNELMERGDEDA